MDKTISDDKVAVKSGYYFEIFNKEEIPKTLKKSDKIVNLNGEVFNLYVGQSIEDERKIDEIFGNRLGYLIEAHLGQPREKPKCKLIGENGNIFNLMAIASRTLRNNNMKELAREMETRIVKSSKSYEEALGVIAEYVEITDKESEEIEEY